jgi:hypothetical protein
MGDKSISSPQQGNLDDCGVFTKLNMVLLSSGVALMFGFFLIIGRCRIFPRIAPHLGEGIIVGFQRQLIHIILHASHYE